jgi:hypothetical protein
MLLRVLLVEPFPQLVAGVAEIAQQRAGVVQLVGQRYQDGVVRRPGQVTDVVFLAFAPRRLRSLERIAAFVNDRGHLGTELLPDLGQRRLTALVFGGVVQ